MTTGSSIVERFYSHFFCRDLTYIFAGGLFISILEFVVFKNIYLPQQISLELIGFLMASYFLGSILRDIASYVWQFKDIQLPENYQSELVLYQDLIKNYDSNILTKYERFVFNLAIAASVGSSSFFGGVLMIIVAIGRWVFLSDPPTINYIGLTAGLVFIGSFLLNDYKKWVEFIEKEQRFLVDNISSYPY